MIPCVVKSRLHARKPRKPGAVRLFSTYRLISSIPFLTIPRHPLSLFPIFRTFFQVPYPASPLFATLTKTAGYIPIPPDSELEASTMGTFPIPYSLPPIPFLFTFFHSLLCFFALIKKTTLLFSNDSALFAKNTQGVEGCY